MSIDPSGKASSTGSRPSWRSARPATVEDDTSTGRSTATASPATRWTTWGPSSSRLPRRHLRRHLRAVRRRQRDRGRRPRTDDRTAGARLARMARGRMGGRRRRRPGRAPTSAHGSDDERARRGTRLRRRPRRPTPILRARHVHRLVLGTRLPVRLVRDGRQRRRDAHHQPGPPAPRWEAIERDIEHLLGAMERL